MEILIKTLNATCSFSQQDGNILDFRNQGVQLFVIDKNNILKPGKEYSIDINLIHHYSDDNHTEDTSDDISGVLKVDISSDVNPENKESM